MKKETTKKRNETDEDEGEEEEGELEEAEEVHEQIDTTLIGDVVILYSM